MDIDRPRRRVIWVVVACLAVGAAASARMDRSPEAPAAARTTQAEARDRAWFDHITSRVDAYAGDTADIGVVHVERPHHMIFRGRDGWLFHGYHDAWSCGGQELQVAELVERVGLAARLLRTSGRDVVLSLVPPKREVMAAFLTPELERFLRCDSAFVDALRAGLTPMNGFIDLRPSLRDAERAGERVWYRDDAHWTPRGAWELTTRVLDAFAPRLAGTEHLRTSRPERRRGDIVRIMGTSVSEDVPRWTIDRPGVSTTRTIEKLPPVPDGTVYDIWRYRTKGPGVLEGRTLMLQDSFGKVVAPQLAMYTRTLTAVHWGAAPRIIGAEAALAERVVLEFIAPFTVAGFSGGSARTPEALAAALRDDLPTRDVMLDIGPIALRAGDKVLLTQAPVGSAEIRASDGDWQTLALPVVRADGWRAAVLPYRRVELRSPFPLAAEVVELPG